MGSRSSDGKSLESDSRLLELRRLRDEAANVAESSLRKAAELQSVAASAQRQVRAYDELIGVEEGSRRPARAETNFLDEVETVLREAGGQSAISELKAELLRRGVPIPGRGDDANLISRINRSGGRIRRVARGVYGLDGPPPAEP